ncbi:YtxH domain-containing protein [Candidatus Palauibacter sp.]|uniref:YtxH domain-containing protein n=1 Tax=Candidatus Palauibacter sp. TaxID=3101350 RepID=UPI003AF27177
MSDQDLQPYVVVERRGSNIVAFIAGALMGAGVALLLAPKSGRETQADLREGARRFTEGAGEKLTDLRDTFEDRYGRTREGLGERVGAIRENVRDRQRKAEEAIKAGKDAARQARSDLEARVAESKAAYRAALAEGPSADVDGEEEAGIAPADAEEEDDEEGDRESPE